MDYVLNMNGFPNMYYARVDQKSFYLSHLYQINVYFSIEIVFRYFSDAAFIRAFSVLACFPLMLSLCLVGSEDQVTKASRCNCIVTM